MADQAKALGLKCLNDGTLCACRDAEASFVGCCTADPCEDSSGTSPDNKLVAATFDRENPVQDFSHECLDGGKWYDCPDLETPFVGCCSQDAHLTNGNAAQIIGKVNPDLSIKVLSAQDLGPDVGE